MLITWGSYRIYYYPIEECKGLYERPRVLKMKFRKNLIACIIIYYKNCVLLVGN